MEFVCKVGSPTGRIVSQTEEAASEGELRQRLVSQGYYIFSLQAKGGLDARLRARRAKKIKADDFVIFNQQFLTLSRSGLPLHRSLELLARQTRSDALREALEDVRDRVRSGVLISEAFEASGKFPKIYCATLRAGERSGAMDKVLAQYVAYQKVSRGFRKKFLAALIYPSFLLVFLAVLISFVVGFVVPRFADLYSGLGVKLPALTLFVINLSVNFRKYGWALIIVAALVALGVRQLRKSAEVKLAWDRFKYRQPVVGKLLLKFSVAEFARTFGTLLQGGLPVVQALETARHSVSSPLLVQAITAAQQEVTGGRSLTASLRMSGFFPEVALDMMEIGEGTGALSSILESMAEFFEEDVNVDLGTLETARHSVSSPLLVQAITAAQQEVTGGRSLTASLRMSGFFPEVALDMMEIGEGTGALSSILESMAEFFEEDVNVDLGTLVSLVDPIMIALIAIVVAFVLVAFYLPLFSLAGQVGG